MNATIRTYLHRHPVRTQRFLEILPGFFSWSLILFPIWGSLIIPEFVAYYVIIFAVYWLYKSVLLSVLAIVSHFKIKAAERFDWIADLKKNLPQNWNSVHHIIIIPTYNEAENIGKMIDYLNTKTFPPLAQKWDLKILVVDGNSPDGTGKVVSYKSKKWK
mgnify:CR=1 FL=1